MKRYLLLLTIIIPISAFTQDKVTAADLKANPKIKREAKRLKKDGWFAFPGAPMEVKIEKAVSYENAVDDKGMNKYLIDEAMATGETQIAARMMALEVAKVNLAGKIQTNVGALIETSIANNQLNQIEAASVTKVVAASKNFINQELGQVIELYSFYKPEGKNMIMLVKIAYNQEMAIEAAKKVLRKKLEVETELLHDKLDKLLDF